MEPFIRDDFSEANREQQLYALLADFWDEMRDAIAESRGIDAALIDEVANNISVRLAEDAKELSLVDDLLFEDELNALLEDKLGEDVELSKISFMEYTVDERMFGIDMSDPDAIMEIFEEGEEEDDENLGGDVAVIYAVGGIRIWKRRCSYNWICDNC